jgi:methionine-rich copper-binding protein CopC
LFVLQLSEVVNLTGNPMEKRVRLVIAGVFATVALVAAASTAESVMHLKLDKSTPEADQVLAQAPDRIVLEFSQKPELSVSRIAVTGAHGAAKTTDIGRSEDDETILWVAFEEPLEAGAYTVNWTTSSGDGHPIRGEFSFTVSAER